MMEVAISPESPQEILLNNGGKTMSSSWADYDNDGDLDVYLANDQSDNALFRNDGNLIFTKMSADPVSNTNSHSFQFLHGVILIMMAI